MQIELEQMEPYYIAALPYYEAFGLNPDQWGINWFPDVDAWCEQIFGKSDIWGEEPDHGWKRMRNKYFFTDDSKRTCFMLRWA